MLRVDKKNIDEKIVLITIENENVVVELLNIGATVRDIKFKGKSITLNISDSTKYLTDRPFINTTVGRVAGRISNGKERIGNKDIFLTRNEFPNHLHGGNQGLDVCLWDYVIKEMADRIEVVFFTTLADGEDGYPGNLKVKVVYTLFKDQDQLMISYFGRTDKTTLFNPTTHFYFNLNQDKSETIEDHYLKVPAIKMGLVDQQNLPQDQLIDKGNFFQEITNGAKIGKLLATMEKQYAYSGINHPFIMFHNQPIELRNSNVILEIIADRDLVVYTGEHFNGSLVDKAGKAITKRAGIALEIQNFPDIGRFPDMGNNILKPKETFVSRTLLSLKEPAI